MGTDMERVKRELKNEQQLIRKLLDRSEWEWRFTKDEREHLRLVLEAKKPKRINDDDWKLRTKGFLGDIEYQCHLAKEVLSERTKNRAIDVREGNLDLLKSCQRTLRLLHGIRAKHRKISTPQTLVDILKVPPSPNYAFEARIYPRVKAADSALRDLMTQLETDLRQETSLRGRPHADSIGFVKAISRCYRKFLGTPTAYKEGLFTEVVETLLKSVGLPSQYPDRAIRAALIEQ
jgi:hypothetical protein